MGLVHAARAGAGFVGRLAPRRQSRSPSPVAPGRACRSIIRRCANAVYRAPYSASLSATGGTGADDLVGHVGTPARGHHASMPAGTLGGTPTEIGPFSVTVRAQDANWPNNVALGGLTLTVEPPVFSVDRAGHRRRRPSASRIKSPPRPRGNVGHGRCGRSPDRCPGGCRSTHRPARSPDRRRSGARSPSPCRAPTAGAGPRRREAAHHRGGADARSPSRTAALYGGDVSSRRTQRPLTASGGTGAIAWSEVSGSAAARRHARCSQRRSSRDADRSQARSRSTCARWTATGKATWTPGRSR